MNASPAQAQERTLAQRSGGGVQLLVDCLDVLQQCLLLLGLGVGNELLACRAQAATAERPMGQEVVRKLLGDPGRPDAARGPWVTPGPAPSPWA